jgi:hypothetical protein
MARTRQTVEVFVVRKHHWWYNDEYDSIISSDPILTFRDREKAEKRRQELERQVRRGEVDRGHYNPFQMAGLDLSDMTSLDDSQLAAAVEALGLEPADHGYWHSWWYENYDDFTPQQREALWGLFDQISFYEVVSDVIEVRS